MGLKSVYPMVTAMDEGFLVFHSLIAEFLKELVKVFLPVRGLISQRNTFR